MPSIVFLVVCTRFSSSSIQFVNAAGVSLTTKKLRERRKLCAYTKGNKDNKFYYLYQFSVVPANRSLSMKRVVYAKQNCTLLEYWLYIRHN